MKNDFIIQPATREEVSFIFKRAGEYNEENVPLMKEQVVERICKVIKDSNGGVIAEIADNLLPWCELSVDAIWTSKSPIKEELKVKLLVAMEFV